MDSDSRWPRWGLSLIFIISLGLLADYLFLHILFQKKILEIRSQTQEEMTSAEADVFSNAPKTLLEQQVGNSVANNSLSTENNGFKAAYAQCFSLSEVEAPESSEHLVQTLVSKKLITSEVIEIENFNFILSDGSERRLHLIPRDNSNGKGREARYYKLDAEGYPERIPLPPSLAADPQNFELEKVSELGKIILHQTKKNYQMQNGDSLNVDVRNGQVYELQWRSQGKSFNCQALECQCL